MSTKMTITDMRQRINSHLHSAGRGFESLSAHPQRPPMGTGIGTLKTSAFLCNAVTRRTFGRFSSFEIWISLDLRMARTDP
jgi:hypothetical protein